MDGLRAIAVILSGVVAGGALNNAIALVPALRRLGQPTELEVRRSTGSLPALCFGAAMVVAMLAVAAVVAFDDDELGSSNRALLLAAIGLGVVTVAATWRSAQIENGVRRAGGDELARRAHAMRRNWQIAQIGMATASLAAVACIVTASGDSAGAGTLDIVQTVLAGLVGGGLLVVEIGIVPTVRDLARATGIRLHVAFDHYVEWSMPPLTIATFVVGVVNLVVNGRGPPALEVAGLIATAVVALISQLVNVPINAKMKKWESGSVPPEYAGMRQRWDRAHRSRTIAGELALVFFVAALIST